MQRCALVIGAAADADFRIDGTAVSSHHALALLDTADVRLLDLGSTNGTFVDGVRLSSDARGVSISSSSTITLGPVALRASELLSRLRGAARAYLVGRGADVDLLIDAPMISTRHLLAIVDAKRPVDGAAVRIIDLCSRNGTFLGARGEAGRRRVMAPIRARAEDILHLGSYRLPIALLLAQVQAPSSVEASVATPGAFSKSLEATHAPSPVRLQDQPLVIGRDPACDVVLPFAQVSARHARLTPLKNGACLVEDLGSTNGTFVDGARVSRMELKSGALLSLGSHPVRVDLAARTIQVVPLPGTVRIDVVEVARVVRHRETGRDVSLVDQVSVSIYPSELVGLMGPSGAGKTTLMQALNGYEPPSSGRVFINGEDLYTNFDRFRGLIGYVPQDDIMHRELTVGEALYYSARLRLPPDTTGDEIERKVRRVLEELKLVDQRNLLIGSPEQKVLSGGQRKRVNLAMELVTDPIILFLDEPTSGLSARDTADVMEVLRELADGGRTIVITIHQPSTEVYARMDHVIQMAKGGRLAFYGPTEPDSYEYFEVSTRTPDRIMDRLETRTPEAWQALYANSSHRQTYVTERQAGLPSAAPLEGIARRRSAPPPQFRQGWILLRRYATMKLRDRTNLVFMVAQAPLVGVLLALAFHGADEHVLERGLPIFIMCLAVIFFGCANACRDIVNERAIYRRERMVNLKIAPYVLSKFVVLGIIGLCQAALLFAITAHWVDFDGAAADYIVTLGLASLAATALGLAISGMVRSAEAAMATVPIVLVFQIMLSGFLLPLQKEGKEYIEVMAAPMIARWSTEALLEVERRGLELRRDEPPSAEAWQAGLMEKNDLTPKRFRFDLSILGGFTASFLVLCFALVKRRDGRG